MIQVSFIIFFVLSVLKIFHQISISWMLVISPLFMYPAFLLLAFLFLIVFEEVSKLRDHL